MSEQDRLESEKLVEVFKARDEWEGNILIGYLRDNGVEATLDAKTPGTEAAAHAGFGEQNPSCGVYVLEEVAERA